MRKGAPQTYDEDHALLREQARRWIAERSPMSVVRRLTDGRCEVTQLEGAHTLEFEAAPAPLYEVLAAAVDGNEG